MSRIHLGYNYLPKVAIYYFLKVLCVAQEIFFFFFFALAKAYCY